MKTLIIGYGNTLRGDDGVGAIVADQIAALKLPNVRSLSVHQLTPELAAETSMAEVIWFVDAWIGGGIHARVDVLQAEPMQPSLDHNWNPSILLYLAKTLYQAKIEAAYHVLIPVTQFNYGNTLSTIAQEGVAWTVQRIQASIETGELLCMK